MAQPLSTTQLLATTDLNTGGPPITYTAEYVYGSQAITSTIPGSQGPQVVISATLLSIVGERPSGLPAAISPNAPATIYLPFSPSPGVVSTESTSSLTAPSTLTSAPVTTSQSESSSSLATTCSFTVNGTSTGYDPSCKPINSPKPAKGRGGVSSGAAAGIAIGCLIAGLLLGLAAAFCFFSRRKQRHVGHDGDVTHVATTPSKDSSYAQVGSGMQNQDEKGMPQLKHFLLDSLSDQELAAELRDRHNLIQQHVENHYHFHPLDVRRVNRQSLLAALSQLGLGQAGSEGPPAETIVSLALDPDTRQIALQHVLSTVIFTSIDPSARSHLSMLPTSVAAFLQSIAPDEQHGIGRQVDSQASTLALHWWRVLSAFLLHPQRTQRTALTPSDAALAPQAAAIAQALNRFLLYFVEDSDTARFQQESHLREVIAECAKFGYVLFSQPSDWCFLHVAGHEQVAGSVRGYRGKVVIAAGLVKHTDKDGRRLGGSAQTSGTLVVPPEVGWRTE
ncbi:hypothetical protein QBC32DRAFT_340937 [Pseudoneurospora amorphoporcata]|uniref:Uncharacterized protein n=1 Tax=Pseudoneurospora amorphoporcata TaxID=241081 RepID=A0AAN6NZ95_9PEZI|nr:hypothetical protein QBC32DRAFT_340937 [Pseudoneurospora amorphoporcata]